jgi:hypothetical protein
MTAHDMYLDLKRQIGVRKHMGHRTVEVDLDLMGEVLDRLNADNFWIINLESALTQIASGVPTDDDWRSAADFMEHVASVLESIKFPRPAYYPED